MKYYDRRTGMSYWTSTPTKPDDHFERLYADAVKYQAKHMSDTIDKDMLKSIVENEMKVGTYVVYIKGGDTNKLGQNKKDIWKVSDISNRYRGSDMLELQSIRDYTKRFETSADNVLSIQSLVDVNNFKQEYFITEAYNRYNNSGKTQKFTESKKMNMNNTNMVSRTMDANVEAAKVAATITAGKTLNSVVAKQLVDRKVLPIMVRGYADTAFGAVVIANIADFAVKQFNVKNPKARLATEAMMQAAMVELLAEIDFEGIINDVLDGVDLGEATA